MSDDDARKRPVAEKAQAEPLHGAKMRGAIVLLPYTSSERWHGRTNYRCNFCSFATLDEARIKRHVAEDCRAIKGGHA